MSILHPTPGQVLDRISILNLKIDAYLKASRDTNALQRELLECEAFMEARGKNSIEIANLRNLLYAANRNLWKCEDEVRLLPANSMLLVVTAKRIAALNDERIGLIRQLDVAYGCTNPVEEKLFHGLH